MTETTEKTQYRIVSEDGFSVSGYFDREIAERERTRREGRWREPVRIEKRTVTYSAWEPVEEAK